MRRRGRALARFLGSALLLSAVLLVPRTVWAVYECGGVQDTCQCGRDNFCICCSDSTHGQNHGNCVWWAWEQACCNWGIGLEWCTDARTWDTYAQNNGYPVVTTPCPNTVFQCEAHTTECCPGSGYGHVGWVTGVYPNGSIDVTEQGCYGWYGVRERTIQAQNASPAMHYILKPGTTCEPCACDPGDQETADCPMCGTKTRTCGNDCQWGPWSDCTGQGECEEGDTRPCGQCGGTQTCDSTCHWGPCEETCPPDAAVWEDAAPTQQDASSSPVDAGTRDAALDAGQALLDASGPSEGGSRPMSPSIRGGCHCRTGAPSPGVSTPAALLLLVALLRRRRRPRRQRAPSRAT